MCMYVGLCEYVHMLMQVPMEAREGTGSPGYVIRGSCEAPDMYVELILDALEEQESLLTAELSPSPTLQF